MKHEPVSLLHSAFIVLTHVFTACTCSAWLVLSRCFTVQPKRALFTHHCPLYSKWTTFEQQSNVPNGDFIIKFNTQTHTHFMESHTRIFWLFLAALLPPQSPLCQPAKHTALQLWFYIPVTQNYSLVHNVSQMRLSQFLVWTQTVGGYGFQRKGVSCFDKMMQGHNWLAGITGVAVDRKSQRCHIHCNFTVPFRQCTASWLLWLIWNSSLAM